MIGSETFTGMEVLKRYDTGGLQMRKILVGFDGVDRDRSVEGILIRDGCR